MKENLVEEIDQADYLTHRLRALEPRPYKLELRRSKAAGFVGGVVFTLVVLAGACAGLYYLAPETLGLILALVS